MLPDNVASSFAIPGLFLPPDNQVITSLVDYEQGGIAINDASQGLMVRTWVCSLDGANVLCGPSGGTPVILFTASGITELSLAFDQNMRPAVAYTESGVVKLRWYDSVPGDYVIITIGSAKNPRLAMDDKRIGQIAISDIILAYLRDGALYYRQQRDRFTIERMLRDGLSSVTRLKNIGMSRNLRLQFELV